MLHHRREHEETIITSFTIQATLNEKREEKVGNRFNAEHIETDEAFCHRQKPFKHGSNEMQACLSDFNAHKSFQRPMQAIRTKSTSRKSHRQTQKPSTETIYQNELIIAVDCSIIIFPSRVSLLTSNPAPRAFSKKKVNRRRNLFQNQKTN